MSNCILSYTHALIFTDEDKGYLLAEISTTFILKTPLSGKSLHINE